MTYTTITRTKGRVRHGNLSCCRSRWSWMSMRAHEYIYKLVTDNHASKCTIRRQQLHAYVWRWCVHACLNTISQHWCGACVKNHTLAPHIERDRFMTCRCTSHFDSMGGILAHTCMCVCSNCIMSSQSMTYIYHVTNKKNNPLLSQINLSCCEAKSSDGPSGPTDGKHRYRW